MFSCFAAIVLKSYAVITGKLSVCRYYAISLVGDHSHTDGATKIVRVIARQRERRT